MTSLLNGRSVAFLSLQILGGHVGMLIILLTIFLSREIVRHPIFVNYCGTWMLFALSYTLLFYAGQIDNPKPNFPLCVTQSAMIYGAPAMGGVSNMVFVLHLYLVLRENIHKTIPKWTRLRLIVMLAAPYAVFLLVFLIAIIAGNNHPGKVHRSSFYCTIKVQSITMVAAGIAAAAIIVALVLEILTAVTLYRNWKTFRTTKTGLNISILVRTFIVVVFSLIALSTSLVFLANLTGFVPNIVIACLPMAAFLVFGSQSDFMRTWYFWRIWGKNRRVAKETSSVSSLMPLGNSSTVKEV